MRVVSRRLRARRCEAAPNAGPSAAIPLAAKAEVVLGLQLVTRQRSVRLAALLAVGVTAAAAASAPSVDRVAHVMLWIAGTLAALAGSRLLASGPALAAARMVVAPCWLAPIGRLLGALCAVVPATLGAGVALLAAAHGAAPVARMAGVTTVYAAAVAAVVMALAPLLGATGAASLGVLGVWLGAASPSAVAGLLAGWPALARGATWAWQLLPLPWHAWRWLERPRAVDALLLVTWVLLGIGVAGWRLVGSRGSGGDGP
jgi:hypothetical protein